MVEMLYFPRVQRLSKELECFQGNVHGRLIPFMIYGIFAFLAAFLVLILPETLNAPLPTTMDESEYFEDFVRERTKHRQPDSRK